MDQTARLNSDYHALTTGAAFIDFSQRGRLCLVGADRQAFLNGQVTNNVKSLAPGQGCYAALVNARGKMTSDLNIFLLADEILLDFEPGLTAKVSERLEKFIIADDVQIVDASTSYGLLCALGPTAIDKCSSLGWAAPANPFEIAAQGEVYVAQTRRLGTPGVDIFYPLNNGDIAASKEQLEFASMESFETVRVERGIPRFGLDMDENTLAPEALGEEAISYSKGCYIGQEVIARIRTYGQVTKSLRGLRFEPNAKVPNPADKILHDGKELGWITSAVFSPKYQCSIALGYVRKECNQIGAHVDVNGAAAEIVNLQ